MPIKESRLFCFSRLTYTPIGRQYRIVALYDELARADPSPVVELNRAVAMRDQPEAGLALIDALPARGELEEYHLAHAARAKLCRRLGRTAEARVSYKQALDLTRPDPERRFLERRLDDLLGSIKKLPSGCRSDPTAID